jgi:malate dehydrogenase (quinone)
MIDKQVKYGDIPTINTDYLLIGGGIMSAHLGVLLNSIAPDKKILIVERLSDCALESSAALNNAGTGHAGYCELNYTPISEVTNEIDITKAVKVNNAFTKSLEFWQHMIDEGSIPSDFLHPVPHYVFVHGEKDVKFLSDRYQAMVNDSRFKEMEYTNDQDVIREWLPLVMNGRDVTEPVAATRMTNAYDIDFGKLTKYLIKKLITNDIKIKYNHEIIDLYKVLDDEGTKWHVIQRNLLTNEVSKIITNFVFIGSGGTSINLLHKSGISAGNGYGGFPVSGQWLICRNPEVVNRHHAKVYGKPSVGAPPMSVPHLDTRIIDNEACLLFGPFAGLSTKFLKYGSNLDFFKSITIGNLPVMLDAGLRNIPLTKYLVKELVKGRKARFKTLQGYFPSADINDWELSTAGQRVQIIKEVDGKGVIEFGTEIVTDSDGSLACLLGASPGASTSLKVMVDVLNECFNLDDEARAVILKMIPSYGN